MSNSRRALASKANLLANAMGNGGRNSGRTYDREGSLTVAELNDIKRSIGSSRMTATDLILAVSRLRAEERSSDLIIGKISDFFVMKG